MDSRGSSSSEESNGHGLSPCGRIGITWNGQEACGWWRAFWTAAALSGIQCLRAGRLPGFRFLRADELEELRSVDDDEARVAPDQPFPGELVHLRRHRLAGGPDEFGQVLVGQADRDLRPLRGLHAVLPGQVQENHREPVVRPGVAERGEL